MCGRAHFNHFTANLLENLLVKEFFKSVEISQTYGHEFVVQFFGPPCKIPAIYRLASSFVKWAQDAETVVVVQLIS